MFFGDQGTQFIEEYVLLRSPFLLADVLNGAENDILIGILNGTKTDRDRNDNAVLPAKPQVSPGTHLPWHRRMLIVGKISAVVEPS